ncbi:MAG: ABC transporter ATP-binding protein [Chloroflexota bacterium]|nr:ABC transporter ATP-binding protein [Chloroflexota bacterium]
MDDQITKETSSVVLQADHLRKDFGGLIAVDDVSLRARAGSLHSIIGPNGAGKTTLFNLLSGIFKPTAGRVIFRGRDITPLPPHRIAHLGIGRSFQITNVFPNLTVLENVRLAAQAMGRDSLNLIASASHFRDYETRAREVLERVGLAEKTAALASMLAHGDKRKLEIGILLASDPQVLLLDEPTAGMASEQVPQLMALIAEIRKQGDKTILLVEHNMDVVMNVSDAITVMHYGKVLAEGTPAQIAANEQVQKAYLGEIYR